ncbi:MAG: GNAT family N-acetyltransferase [Candidatus Lokiarchaeota archaeon]|nr:GNAT family N-acetyltransferase [Candidatus Lokiarchaeota archaeon]
MRKRTVLIILFVMISTIVQLFGIPYLGVKSSSHDIEFEYVYNWDLIGTGGWYEGYTETFRATGHYIIDFNGNYANVTARISWTWEENYYGYFESDIDDYIFSYSLIDGSYVWGTDQEDLDTTGMNVWFHIPGGIQASTYFLLDISFEVLEGYHNIWVGHLMPFLGNKLYRTGSYVRDDIYGTFDANYEVSDYFTPDGFLIGEVYTEFDDGYDRDTHFWSQFQLNSVIFITSANYLRPFNIGMYLLAYWFPIFCFVILFYVVYENLRWRPRITPTKEGDIVIERNLPQNAKFAIESAYSEMIPSFLVRARAHDKKIVCAYKNDLIEGIGFIETDEKVGTFYGSYVSNMAEYAKVKYAFTEISRLKDFRTIETFDIFKVSDLDQRDLSFDTNHIRPLNEQHLDAVMKMIANEDSGKKSKKYAKWVIKSSHDDIAVVAIASINESWVQTLMTELNRRNYPKPEMLMNEIVLGAGFLTPGETQGWLYGLYVHPAFRNQGIGRMIVLSRLSALKELGLNSAITEIAEWNSPAKNIYDDFNAEIIGKINLLGKEMPKVKVRRY